MNNASLLGNINTDKKHFDSEYNGRVCHFQLTDNELNQDAIIFTTTLAKILRLCTFDYRKYNCAAGKFFIYSKYVDFEKLTEGSKIINSYNIDEIRKEFIAIDKNKGAELFRQFCQMIILDTFTLNCDRTHNNWLMKNGKVLAYDYNFTFGSAELLHGVSNEGFSRMLSEGIIDGLTENLVDRNNKFLYNRFKENSRLDFIDFAEYTLEKLTHDPAHIKTGDDQEGVGLIPSYKGLIQYFIENNIELDLINKVINLSAGDIFESAPSDSKINSFGNRRYLTYMFDYIKKLI